jgi:hypothetical protein
MIKLTLTATFLLLINSLAFNQTKNVSKDFNKDGVIDKVIITKDWGSSISTTDIQYSDGKSKRKYEFSGQYSSGSFFTIINAPNVLDNSGREQLGDMLFGRRDTIDASLNWLIDACSNIKKIKDSQLVDFATTYSPVWITGEPKLPESYYSILSNNKFEKLLRIDGAGSDYKSDYFWIDYKTYGHKKQALARTKGNGTIETIKDTSDFKVLQVDPVNWIYTSTNGVILKYANKYSWVFINDNKAFEANEKLRWPSIMEAQMFNGFVLIRQSINSGSTNLFIVNPQSGFVFRLNNELIKLNSVDKIELDKMKEAIEMSDSEGNLYILTLAKVKETFEVIGQVK